MRVSIASDHAGFDLKEYLKKNITRVGPEPVEWVDWGPSEGKTSVDYPDFANKVTNAIIQSSQMTDPAGSTHQGILICGSGIGVSIAANRVPGIRAALVHSVEEARLSRQHNDANVLCLGARFIEQTLAAEITREWLRTPTSPDERHRRRIKKLG